MILQLICLMMMLSDRLLLVHDASCSFSGQLRFRGSRLLHSHPCF